MKETTINIAEHSVRFTLTEKGARILSIFKEHATVKAGDTITMPFRKLFYFFGVAFHSFDVELFVNNEITAVGEVTKSFTYYFKDGRKFTLDGADQTAAWSQAGYTNEDLSSLQFSEENKPGAHRYEYIDGQWRRKLTVRERIKANMKVLSREERLRIHLIANSQVDDKRLVLTIPSNLTEVNAERVRALWNSEAMFLVSDNLTVSKNDSALFAEYEIEHLVFGRPDATFVCTIDLKSEA